LIQFSEFKESTSTPVPVKPSSILASAESAKAREIKISITLQWAKEAQPEKKRLGEDRISKTGGATRFLSTCSQCIHKNVNGHC